MKQFAYALCVLASISSITHSMHNEKKIQQEQGKEGFLSDALSVISNPLLQTAGTALKEELTVPLKAQKEQMIAEIVSPIISQLDRSHAALMAQIIKMQEEIQRLREAQENKCCSLQ